MGVNFELEITCDGDFDFGMRIGCYSLFAGVFGLFRERLFPFGVNSRDIF